jgi:hypothetical protein
VQAPAGKKEKTRKFIVTLKRIGEHFSRKTLPREMRRNVVRSIYKKSTTPCVSNIALLAVNLYISDFVESETSTVTTINIPTAENKCA